MNQPATWEDQPRPWRMYYLVSRKDGRGKRVLLYVGITSRGYTSKGLLKRWCTEASSHEKTKEWWPDVDVKYSKKLTRDWPAYRREIAERFEYEEIKRLKPCHNIKGGVDRPLLGWPTWDERRRREPVFNPNRREHANQWALVVLAVCVVLACVAAFS